MIEIRNLTKIFKPRSKDSTVALDDVNISFPNKGLVFVVGKSGSGKTTLLSLIGGLDKANSGEIFVNNENITKYTHRALDNYRNNTVGYIFQDYQLIENLTIYENLKMMLDFKNEKDDSKIKEALKEVGLEGYEARFPKELSGGQQQRISIARILVKNPSIILADEPTGNLDLKNTKLIFSLLKELGKTKLVLVVSHDLYSANEFADYIIYLKKGKIISKYKKTNILSDELVFKNNILYVPAHKNIDFSNKNEIIEKLNTEEIKDIIQTNNNFEECDFKFENNVSLDKSKKHLSFKNGIKYGFKFYRGLGVKSLVFSIFISILLGFISLFITINTIDEDSQRAENLIKNTPNELALVAKDIEGNSSMNMSTFDAEIDPSYKEVFKKAGYTGNIYEATNTDSDIILPNSYLKAPFFNLNRYIKAEESYYVKLFGVDGKLVFLDKNDTQYEDGIYVSDVFAYLYSRKNDITTRKTFYKLTKQNNYLINGIIKTNCETRFPNIYKNYVLKYEKDVLKSLNHTDEYIEFPTVLESIYLCGFGLSKTCFSSNFNNADSYKLSVSKNVLKIDQNTYSLPSLIATPSISSELPELKSDELIIEYNLYNLITGKNITKNFKYYKKVDPINVSFSSYNLSDSKLKAPKFEKEMKIVGIIADNPKIIMNFDNKVKIANKFDTIEALYFDDMTQIKSIIKGAKELNLIPIDYQVYTHRVGNSYIDTLNEFFTFLLVIIVFITLICLIFYNIKIIHNRYFEIGVMKSLGAKDSGLMTMFSINLILTYLKTAIFFNGITYLLIGIVNKILVRSINSVTASSIIYLSNSLIIFTKGSLLIFMNIIILLAFIIAYIIPFLKIRFIKPTNIVKAKE